MPRTGHASVARPRQSSYGHRSHASRSDRNDRSDAGPSRSRRRAAQDEDDEEEEEVEEEEEPEDADEEADEEEEADPDDDEGSDAEGDAAGKLKMPKRKKLPVTKTHKKNADKIGKEEITRRANDLVRYALFCEYRRMPIKREDISKKVLGQAARTVFPIVFNKATKTLRSTFGMEMVQLRARGADNEQILAAIENTGTARKRKDGDDDEDAEAGGKKGGSRSWILRSLLPSSIIRGMQAPIPDLAQLHAEADGRHDNVTGQHDAEGSMLDWKRADGQLGSMGLLFVVLSLILLNGRTIRDDELRAQLRRFFLEPTSVLPAALRPDAYEAPSSSSSRRGRTSASQGGALSGASSGSSMTLEGFLSLMVRQSYLEQIVSATAGPSTQGGSSMGGGATAGDGRRKQRRGAAKSGEAGEGRGGAEEQFEWRWGARAEAEIGEKAVARFVGDVFYATPLLERARGGRGGTGRRRNGGTTRSGRTSRGGRGDEEDDVDDSEDDEDDDDDDIEEVDAEGNSVGGASQQQQQRDAGGEGQQSQASQRKKQKLGLIKEIERAAGSQLIE